MLFIDHLCLGTGHGFKYDKSYSLVLGGLLGWASFMGFLETRIVGYSLFLAVACLGFSGV